MIKTGLEEAPKFRALYSTNYNSVKLARLNFTHLLAVGVQQQIGMT